LLYGRSFRGVSGEGGNAAISLSSRCASNACHRRTADIDEQAIGDRASDPKELVLLLGREKAKALLPRLAGDEALEGSRILLTGDQVVLHDGKVLEKPADLEEVRRNIHGYGKVGHYLECWKQAVPV
jgi:predicted house-cleaning NTP pyrophosphatase (Maf/HAM1 superfamily)